MLRQVLESFGQFRTKRAKTRDELVRKVLALASSDKPLSAELINEAISLGFSVDELEKLATVLASRMDAAASLVKSKTLQADYDRKSEESTAAYREVQALEERHRQELEAAQQKYRAIEWDRRSIHNQADMLRTSAMGTLIGTADPAIAQQIAALHQSKSALRNDVNLRATQATMPIKPDERDTLAMERYAEAIKQRREWLASVDRDENVMNQQILELEARRLDPAACAIG